jgi:hypothetical protein
LGRKYALSVWNYKLQTDKKSPEIKRIVIIIIREANSILMPPRSSSGTCLLCKTTVGRIAMPRHTQECLKKSDWPESGGPSYIIRVEGFHSKMFWLLVLARHDAELSDLDSLLRDVWVECCEHLSAFNIYGRRFSSYSDYDDFKEDGESGLSIPLDEVIGPDSSFTYEYDFGSTTKLKLSVVGISPVVPKSGSLCLIARNNRPKIPCYFCKEKGEYLVTNWPDNPYQIIICRDCTKKKVNDLESEFVMVFPNSPRAGVCGYMEEPISAIRWYPKGWHLGDIYPAESEEMLNEIMSSDEDDVYTPLDEDT